MGLCNCGFGCFQLVFGDMQLSGLAQGWRAQQKNICTWLNKCNSFNLFKRFSNILSQSASLKGGLHM